MKILYTQALTTLGTQDNTDRHTKVRIKTSGKHKLKLNKIRNKLLKNKQ